MEAWTTVARLLRERKLLALVAMVLRCENSSQQGADEGT